MKGSEDVGFPGGRGGGRLCLQTGSATVFVSSHHVDPLFLLVTCVSVVSFLASCQGSTRYGVRVETPPLRGPDAVRCCVVTV